MIEADCVYNAKMAANYNFEQKEIQITKFNNPHKFWYKHCNDATEEGLLKDLERKIEEYVNESMGFEGDEPILTLDDVVCVHHPVWKRWIRGSIIKRQENDEESSIRLWLIDYGCKLKTTDRVVPLKDEHLAYSRAINVHLGGLSDIIPAKLVCYGSVSHYGTIPLS